MHSASTRWLVVVLLAIAAGGLLVELGRGMSTAQGQTSGISQEPSAKLAGDIQAVTGPLGRDGFGLYLIDTGNRTIAVYQYQGKNLRWLASRNFTYDMRIEDYNTQISPKEVKRLSQQAESLDRPGDQP